MYKFHLPSDEVPSEFEISLNPENQKLLVPIRLDISIFSQNLHHQVGGVYYDI